jgi:hypothetical protein
VVSECDARLNETRLARQELALLMDEMAKMKAAQATNSAEIVQLKDEIEQKWKESQRAHAETRELLLLQLLAERNRY